MEPARNDVDSLEGCADLREETPNVLLVTCEVSLKERESSGMVVTACWTGRTASAPVSWYVPTEFSQKVRLRDRYTWVSLALSQDAPLDGPDASQTAHQ